MPKRIVLLPVRPDARPASVAIRRYRLLRVA